jgi:hypothetical protein
MRPNPVSVVLVLCLAACETTEVQELRRALRSCEEDLVKKRVIADNLNQYRRNKAILERRLHEATEGVAARKIEGKGTAADALAALHASADLGGLLESFKIDEGGSWKATFGPLPLPPQQDLPRSEPSKPPPMRCTLPARSIFSGSQGQRLRLEIERYEKEIADLDRIMVEVARYEVDIKAIDDKLKVLDVLKSGRVGPGPGSVESFFGGERPLFRSGQVDFKLGNFSVSGKLAAGRTQDEVRAAIPTGFIVRESATK